MADLSDYGYCRCGAEYYIADKLGEELVCEYDDCQRKHIVKKKKRTEMVLDPYPIGWHEIEIGGYNFYLEEIE